MNRDSVDDLFVHQLDPVTVVNFSPWVMRKASQNLYVVAQRLKGFGKGQPLKRRLRVKKLGEDQYPHETSALVFIQNFFQHIGRIVHGFLTQRRVCE